MIMNIYFKISELVITGKTISLDVADKLMRYHIIPMNAVRAHLGRPVWASQKSGYRPLYWEKAKGRNGKSEHCFNGKGAVDWTCSGDIDELLAAIIEFTDYTRIAVYYQNHQRFIHCDYKAIDGKRYIYSSTPSSRWTLIRTI